MTIFQGQNDSLDLLYPSIISESDRILATLKKDDEILKEWNIPVIDEDLFSLELSEDETMNYRPGLADLDIKVMNGEGQIRFCQTIGVAIVERFNKQKFGGANG